MWSSVEAVVDSAPTAQSPQHPSSDPPVATRTHTHTAIVADAVADRPVSVSVSASGAAAARVLAGLSPLAPFVGRRSLASLSVSPRRFFPAAAPPSATALAASNALPSLLHGTSFALELG